MAQLATLDGGLGPLARTARELEMLRRLHAFRRGRELRSRRLLRESDLLCDLIEQCRLRGHRLLPTQLWMHAVRFVRAISPQLRDELGINRDPDHVGEVIFAVQEILFDRIRTERRPQHGVVVPLFPDGAQLADAAEA